MAGRGRRAHPTVLGPHSPYVCPPEFLERVAGIARKRRLPVHIHVAESAEQVGRSREKFGRTPIAHLESCGLLDVPATLAHALYVDEADVEILARHDVTVVRCPVTYMRLSMGSTPAGDLVRRGIRVAVGTDGPGSNDDMDMLISTRMLALLEKHVTADATSMPGDLPLRCAARGGAIACGFPGSGTITAGAAADLAVVDLSRPHLRPRHDLVSLVVHCAHAGDVSDVMCQGRWLMRDRVILTLDEERILAEADARARAMVRKSMQVVRSYQG